jgi:hypothetical protein
VVVNPQEDVVKYHAGTGESIIASCIVNGYSMDFTYIQSTKSLNVSLTFALKMLKDGNITKNDFEGDVTKILAGGTIVDRAAFYIKEIRIGNKTVNDLAATVIHNQETPLLFGENTLKMFGKFKIDKEKSEIVFE